MAKIGSFKKVSGDLKGAISTLTLQVKEVRFVPDGQEAAMHPATGSLWARWKSALPGPSARRTIAPISRSS
jgi:uncharacterized protein (DUF736 family)